MKKVKINEINKNFWLVPTIVTASKRRWTPRPYSNLKKLLVVEKLWDQNLIIDLNGDKDLKIFRQLLQFKDNPFTVNKQNLQEIEDTGFVDIKIKESKIHLWIDKKGIKAIKGGTIPFCQKNSLYKIRRESISKNDKTILIWRKDGFLEISDKLKNKLQNIKKEVLYKNKIANSTIKK